MKNNKKAFTIVELIIVIVIIAILAGILIPNIFRHIEKTRYEKDMELVRNLNTALVKDESTDGKHANMTEALRAADDYGYDVGKINKSKVGNEILWDSVNDVFCYLDGKEIKYIPEAPKAIDDVKEYEYFVIKDVNAESDLHESYSTYIRNLNTSIKTLNTNKGLDTGKNNTIETVNYTGEATPKNNVIIRTMGGQLVINASQDTVKHFGALSVLDIQSIANKSYHEFGEVVFASIKTGHISFEEKSSIQAVHVVANEEQKFDPIIISFKEEVEQPQYSRDAAVIDSEEGTKVCTLALPEETNNIILYKQGIYEQIKLQPTTVETEQETTSTQAQTWVTETATATEDTKSASNQLANELNGTRNAETGKIENQEVTVEEVQYTVVFNNETKEFETYQNYVDEDNKGQQVADQTIINTVSEEVTTETGKDKEEVKNEVITTNYVQAQVDSIDVNTNPVHFWLYAYNNIADEANLDTAYVFKGFTDEEFELMAKFIDAKDENGDPIFSIDNIDLSSLSQANIDKALEYVQREYNLETRQAIEKIISQKSPYFNWLCDFEVSFDHDIAEGSVALAGYYGVFATNYYEDQWLGFGLPAISGNNEPIRLLQSMGSYSSVGDFEFTYIAILAIVQQFSCGAVNLSNENIGTTMTVELCIYNYDEQGNQTDRIVCGTYTYTFGEIALANASYIK